MFKRQFAATLLSFFLLIFTSAIIAPPIFSADSVFSGDCGKSFAALRSKVSVRAKIQAAEKIQDDACPGGMDVLKEVYGETADFKLKLKLLSTIGLSGDLEYSKKILDLAGNKLHKAYTKEGGFSYIAMDEMGKLLEDVVPAKLLVKFISDQDPKVRKNAAELLGTFPDFSRKDDGDAELLQMVASSSGPGRAEATGILARSENQVYAYALGLLAEADKDPLVRLAAVKGVCRMRLEACGKDVKAAADSLDEDLRKGIYEELSQGHLKIADEDYIALAGKPYSSGYPAILANALRLKYASHAPAGADELSPFLNNNDLNVRRAAYDALLKLDSSAVCPYIVPVVLDTDPQIQKLAFEGAQKYHCAGALEPLARATEAASTSEKWPLIPALAAVGGKAGLAEAMKYSDGKYLKVYVGKACQLAGDEACALRIYSECLADRDSSFEAARGLASLGSAAAREALLNNIRAEGADTDPYVISVLGQVGGKQIADELWTVYQKKPLMNDRRLALLAALIEMKDPRATEPALALLEDPGTMEREHIQIAQLLADSGERRVLDALGNFMAKNAAYESGYYINPVEYGNEVVQIFSSLHDKAHVGAIIDFSRRIMSDGNYCYCKDWDTGCMGECEMQKTDALKSAADYLGAAADPKALQVLPEMLAKREWDDENNVRAAMKACSPAKSLTEITALYKACGSLDCKIEMLSAAGDKNGAALVRFLSGVYYSDKDQYAKNEAAELLNSNTRLPESLAEELHSTAAAVRAEAAWAIGAAVAPLPSSDRDQARDPGYASSRSATLAYYKQLGFSVGPEPARPELAALSPALISALNDRNTSVRSNAARALSRIYDERAGGGLALLLRDPSPEVRVRAAEALNGVYGSDAASALAGALKDPAARVRRAAAASLGAYTADSSGPALASALDDPDPAVVSYALASLGNIRYQGAVRAVIAKASPGSRWANEAISVLGNIGGEAAADFLSAMDRTDPKHVVPAVAALGMIRDAPVSAALGRFSVSFSTAVRAQALGSLAQVSVSDNIDAIIGLTSDLSPEIRFKAVSYLGRAEGSAVPKAAGRLMQLLTDGNKGMRTAALEALARLKAPNTAAAVMDALKTGNVQAAEAVSALGDIGEPEAFDAIVGAKGADHYGILRAVAKLRARDARPCEFAALSLYFHPQDVRMEAIRAMGALCKGRKFDRETLMLPAEPAGMLSMFLHDGHTLFSEEAALSLGLLGDARAMPELSSMLADPGSRKKAQIMKSIASIGGSEAVKLLAGQIKDGNLTMAMQAVNLIAAVPGQDAPAALLGAMKTSGRDIRMAIIPALGKFKYPPAFEALLESLTKGDPGEKTAAALGLGISGESRALGSLKKAALDNDERVKHAAAEAIMKIEKTGV